MPFISYIYVLVFTFPGGVVDDIGESSGGFFGGLGGFFSDVGDALRVGQYVTATLTAERLNDVYVLPRSAVREDREIVLIDNEGLLRKVPVTVAWSDEEFSAIEASEQLPESPVVVTTVLGTVIDGTKVRATIDGVAPAPPQRPSGNAGGKPSGGQGGDQSGAARPAAGGKPDAAQPAAKPAAKSAAQPQTNSRATRETSSSEAAGQPAAVADQAANFTQWRDIIESGGSLPEDDKQQVRDRIAAGGRVPPWLRAAVQ